VVETAPAIHSRLIRGNDRTVAPGIVVAEMIALRRQAAMKVILVSQFYLRSSVGSRPT
jgi:hypothetical protein